MAKNLLDEFEDFEDVPNSLLKKTGNAVFDALNQTLNNSEQVNASNDALGVENDAKDGEECEYTHEDDDDDDVLENKTEPINTDSVSFKLSELLDAEFIVMVVDMLLSFSGSVVINWTTDLTVKSDDLAADDFQKQLLLKAYVPAFDKIQVKTDNPIYALLIGTAAVYGKNIAAAIMAVKENKKPEKTIAKYSKPRKQKTKK